MNEYKELELKYERLKDEFENYQNFAENTMQMMNEKNSKLEKKLDVLSSMLEISKYINSNISSENLISMINDMIIGIIGVTYSSIYLKERGNFNIKATNNGMGGIISGCPKEYLDRFEKGEPFIVNSKEPLFCNVKDKVTIHSIIGVPIYLREMFIGYIIVEHSLCSFFNHEHIKFISSIANQIGIALENNILYNKVKENSIKDALLNIYNRKHFFDLVEKRLANFPSKNFAIVMMDLDNFKKVNDIYGHQFGDEVLISTSKVIKNNIDKADLVGRYGGEEIIIYVDDAENKEKVYKKIENIRYKISKNVIEYGEVKRSVTASFGISYRDNNVIALNEVLKGADKRLYSAKRSGKNKVMSY